jgi:hypothetical protein
MQSIGRPLERGAQMPRGAILQLLCLLLLLACWATGGHGMTDETIASLR